MGTGVPVGYGGRTAVAVAGTRQGREWRQVYQCRADLCVFRGGLT